MGLISASNCFDVLAIWIGFSVVVAVYPGLKFGLPSVRRWVRERRKRLRDRKVKAG